MAHGTPSVWFGLGCFLPACGCSPSPAELVVLPLRALSWAGLALKPKETKGGRWKPEPVPQGVGDGGERPKLVLQEG